MRHTTAQTPPRSSRHILITTAIILIFFIQAFAIIICKDYSRRLFIAEQKAQTIQQKLRNHWSQLLLEYSTLTTPIRIQQMANTQLNMIFPKKIKLIMIHPTPNTTNDDE